LFGNYHSVDLNEIIHLTTNHMNTKDLIKTLNTHAPLEMAELKAALAKKLKPSCEDCGGTGICGDEGPGRHNAHFEWVPCDCPAGTIHKSIPEGLPEHKADQIRTKARIEVLEDALNEIFHRTDSTTAQMEIIQKVLPQGGEAKPPQKGPPPPKSFPEKLLSLSDWLRGRAQSTALKSTTMTMLQDRVARLSQKYGHDSRKSNVPAVAPATLDSTSPDEVHPLPNH
jgi:hypothetical protein